MEWIKGIQDLTHFVPHPVVTIGNFDGVHLGHQKIIQQAVEQARMRKGKCIAYTFRPHPQLVLRPEVSLQLLSTYDEKLALFESLGVDLVIEEPFSRKFSALEPEEFFSDILLNQLSAEAIVVGYDFTFGRERHGHLEALDAFCKSASVDLTVVCPQSFENGIISSSKIRKYLLAGEVPLANRLLGHEFFYQGVVIPGEGRGRKIGFPTVNFSLPVKERKLSLPHGVYATRTVVDGNRYPSITNIGVRPTFHDASQAGGQEIPILVETHFLNFSQNLYGASLEVRFIEQLREERRFSGADTLKAQILLDIEESKKILNILD